MLNLVKNGVRRAKTNGGIAPVSLALSTDGSTELSELKGPVLDYLVSDCSEQP